MKGDAVATRAGHPGPLPREHPRRAAAIRDRRQPARLRRRLLARPARRRGVGRRHHPRRRGTAGRRARHAAGGGRRTTAPPPSCSGCGSPRASPSGRCWKRPPSPTSPPGPSPRRSRRSRRDQTGGPGGRAGALPCSPSRSAPSPAQLRAHHRSLARMPRRIDIELTSSREDGSWTWRAAGAKEPRGTVPGGVLPDTRQGRRRPAGRGRLLRRRHRDHRRGAGQGPAPEPERLELLLPADEAPLVTSSVTSRAARRPRPAPRRTPPRRATAARRRRAPRGAMVRRDRGDAQGAR